MVESTIASRARIIAAGDEMRRRIERDLHDGVQQRLVSLALDLNAIRAGLPPDSPELDARLARIAAGLAGAVDEIREIAHGVHPAALAEGGLGPALRGLARRCAIPVELGVSIEARLPPPVEIAAYYVVAEALTNAAKHARAPFVRVDAYLRHGWLCVSVRDEGAGGADPAQGTGLIGLIDRVHALGGTIAIRSRPGEGTTIDVRLRGAGADMHDPGCRRPGGGRRP